MSGFNCGDLIVKSYPYVYALSNEVRGNFCDFCFKRSDDLKRCSQCAYVYFCNRECQEKAWHDHKKECKLIIGIKPNVPTPTVRMLTQIWFKIKKSGQNHPEVDIHGRKVSFQTLMSHSNEIKQSPQSVEIMTTIYECMKLFIKNTSVVPSPNEFIEIFGKELINTFSITEEDTRQAIGSGLYLGVSVFDHSCEPDAIPVFEGITLSVRAVKNIPHRDVNKIYIPYIDTLQLNAERQNILRERYFFDCNCARCISTYYDDLMNKSLTNKNIKVHTKRSNQVIQTLKELKKRKENPCHILDNCEQELKSLEGIFAKSHINRLHILEMAFDASIDSEKWENALMHGQELLELYKLYCGDHDPVLGIHYFKLGKLDLWMEMINEGMANLQMAQKILKITHGEEHSLYKSLSQHMISLYSSSEASAIT